MKKVIIMGIVTVSLLLNNCQMKLPEESDLPSWSVTLEVPLLEKAITLDELLDDSLIVSIPYGTSGDSIYAYEDEVEIEKVEVGDQLNIGDIEQSFTQSVDDVTVDGSTKHYSSQLEEVGVDPVGENVSSELGKISLNNTDSESTDPILLTDIIDLSGVLEGETAIISSETSFPTIYREITFDNFSNAEFTSGELVINIVNNLVIELGAPVTIRLLDADSSVIYGSDGDSAKAEWTAGIQSDNSAMEIISLTGKTLPGTVILKITGVVCGSGPQDIVNNETTRNSSFVVQVQANDLEVSSAKAIIPEQTVDTTGVITLVESDNKVQTAKIKEGTLAINITNNLPIDANLDLTISSIDVSEDVGKQAFHKIIPLMANQSSNNAYSLTDNLLVMDVNDQKVEYSYQIITIDTDPNKVLVSETDGVIVDISLYGGNPGEEITFSAFEGKVCQDPIIEEGEIDVTSGSKITSATVSSGSMTILIRNNVNLTEIGIPHITLNIPEFRDPSGNSIHEVRDLYPEPNTTIVSIDLIGYTLLPNTVDVSVDSFTQNITYNTEVIIPSDEIASYNLLGAIDVDIDVSDLTFSSVTGFFNQDAIVEENTIEIDDETKIEEAMISSGDLVLTVINNVGAIATVNFTVNEIVKKTDNTPFQYTINLGSGTEPVVHTIPLRSYKIQLPIGDLSMNQEINYTSIVNLPSDEAMTLTFGNEINVKVQLKDLAFSRVTGYIDTVIVDIDSIEQDIDALPEELEGINLTNVDIILDFDTNIGVPVELNLMLVSFNDKGDTSRSKIHQNITSNPRVIIPNAADLINIKPRKIIAYGSASVGGTGTVSTDQYVGGTMYITVPMEMEILENAEININPKLVQEDIPEELESIKLYSKMDNKFEFGGDLEVLAAKDTVYFEEGSVISPDTLAIFHLLPDSFFTDVIYLDESKFLLFQDSLYIKAKVKLLGLRDENDNIIPSRLLKSDSLAIQLYGSIKGLIDLKGNDN